MNKSKGYVNTDYLNEAAKIFAPIKQRSHALLEIEAGQKIIDIGCGPGHDTCAIASAHPELSQVVGVDYDAQMIEQAQQRSKPLALGGKLNHQCASVYELPFADNSFDGIRAERFFMHLEHPAQAMREIKRIAKPGAKLVFVETDWGSMSVNFGLDKYERQLSEFYAIEFLNNGFSARNMRALLQQIGAPLQQCFVDPIQTDDANLWQLLSQYPAMLDKALEAGLINPTEHTKINGNIKHWNHSDQFFCTVNVLSFAATLNN